MPTDPQTGQWYPSGGVPPLTAIPYGTQAAGGFHVPTAGQEVMAEDRPIYWAGQEEGYSYMDTGVGVGVGLGAGAFPVPLFPPVPLPGPLPVPLPGPPGIVSYTAGAEALDGLQPGEGPPMGLPIIAGLAGMALGTLRALWAKFGAAAIKALVGAGVFAAVMKLILGDDPDTKIIDVDRLKRRKRYTIGSNPRVRTLQKVSRHCQRLLKRHEKVIREFLPKKQARYGIPPSRALSAIERAAIKG